MTSNCKFNINNNIVIINIELLIHSKNNRLESLTNAALHDPHKLDIPPFLVVTSSVSGSVLFILKHNENEHFEILTARELYDRQIQWFEPLADNYRKLLFTNLKEDVKSSYKVFTWNDIYQFSAEDRWSISYRSGGSGDWKSATDGADGYLLSLINNHTGVMLLGKFHLQLILTEVQDQFPKSSKPVGALPGLSSTSFSL